MAYAGVCGSDLHYYYEGANGAFVIREPLVPGHEVYGTVDLDPTGTFAPARDTRDGASGDLWDLPNRPGGQAAPVAGRGIPRFRLHLAPHPGRDERVPAS